jgi:hypothetical protein
VKTDFIFLNSPSDREEPYEVLVLDQEDDSNEKSEPFGKEHMDFNLETNEALDLSDQPLQTQESTLRADLSSKYRSILS